MGKVNKRDCYLDPSARGASNDIRLKLGHFNLSRRETEVAVLAIQGYSNRMIAEQLFITEQTVKDHMNRILEKAFVSSRGEFTAKVLGLRDTV